MKILIYIFIIFNIVYLIQSQSYLENYNPIHITGSELFEKDWPLQSSDYVSLIRGGLCSIPVFGAAIDSIFGVIWGKLYPHEQYVTVENFEKRMETLMNDMKAFSMDYTDKKIEETIIELSRLQFDALVQASKEYRELLDICTYEMATLKETTIEFKRNFPAIHYLLSTKFQDALLFFSSPRHIHLLGKVYLETAVLYQAFLRDSHFNGIQYGIVQERINGIESTKYNVTTYYDKMNQHTYDVLSNYALFLNEFVEYKIKKEIQDFSQCNLKYSSLPYDCRTLYPSSSSLFSDRYIKIPMWYPITSTLFYSNLELFPSYHERREASPIYIHDMSEKPSKFAFTVDFTLIGRNAILTHGAYGRRYEIGIHDYHDFVTYSEGYWYVVNPGIVNQGKPYFIRENRAVPKSDKTLTKSDNYAVFGSYYKLNPKSSGKFKFRLYYTSTNLFYNYDNTIEFIIYDGGSDSSIDYMSKYKDLKQLSTTSYNLNHERKSSNGFYKYGQLSKGYKHIQATYYIETQEFNLKTSNNLLLIMKPLGNFSAKLLSITIFVE